MTTLLEPKRVLPDSQALPEFLAAVPPLPARTRYDLCDQALVLLEDAYVHLRLKRAMHAIDPVQRVRLLARRLDDLTDLQFHAELAAIFRSLRDLHTVYQLPDPYRGHVATLGFLVERCTEEDGAPCHLVTKVHRALVHGGFRAGVEVLALNGVPIERAVELNADRQPGSNAAARLARGLEALTLRPLRNAPPPDEHWVVVAFKPARGPVRETRIPWRVQAADTLRDGRAQDPVPTISRVLGIDAGNESSRQVKRRLFAKGPAQQASARSVDTFLDARTIPRAKVGYLRLYSFNVTSARRGIQAVADALRGLPREGLVVDIRGNPGGSIPAAEGILQLLTERDVQPARFSLATTPLMTELCQTAPGFRPWEQSVSDAVETGESYSQPLPLSDPPDLAHGLRRYRGPVVLVCDALSYSAADIFAAGFQDNGIGRVLGTATHTGAGGANVWAHDLLSLWLPDAFPPLESGTSFRVALRRSTRVGDRDGVPLEDLGVAADAVHALTRRDITSQNEDLVAAAVAMVRAT